MRLSVVICTHNPTRDLLRRVLDAVVEQVDAAGDAEVIVVDNNSMPPLDEWEVLSAYPVHRIRQPIPGLTAAREAGIAAAAGEVIVFVDDDNVLGNGYLDTVRRLFTENHSVGVAGGNVVPEYQGATPRIGDFESCLAVRRYTRDTWIETVGPPYSEHFPIGAGIAVRRQLAVEYVDDCAETMRIEGHMGDLLSSGEDLDLDLFALSRGYTLAISGELTLTHVISRARTEQKYLERLVVGSIEGSFALEQKWSGRFKQPVFPTFSASTVGLFSKLVGSAVTRWSSPRHQLRYRMFATLVRIRLFRLLSRDRSGKS